MIAAKPTRIRVSIVAVTTLMAVLFYLDRNCIGFAETFIRQELSLTDQQVAYILAIFYFAYALGQVPAGWLTDRFGARLTLALYILLWSLFTALTGLAYGVATVLLFRLLFGFAQAGGYPAAAKLVSNWTPLAERGLASGWVSSGGRIGGIIAPILTAYCIVLFVPPSHDSTVLPADVLNPARLCHEALHGARAAQAASAVIPDRKQAMGKILLADATPAQREAIDAASKLYAAGKKAASEVSPEQRLLLAQWLNQSGVWQKVPPEVFMLLPLEREGWRLFARGQTLTSDEDRRLNRLVLEAAFPESLRKVYVAGWRQVMWTYGVGGVAVALVFFFWFRDDPRQHPFCNAAEVKHILGPAAQPAKRDRLGLPLGAILRSRDLWLSCVTQITVNWGWVFLVMLLPKYLERQHHVDVETRGVMQSLVIGVGWVGMVLGGPLTDFLVRKVGLRWGRALPMGVTRLFPAAAYLLVLLEPGPWTCVALFCVVAFATDLGVPAIWAYTQDVGGKHTASILGWGNMWGNFGAMAATYLLSTWDWPWVFVSAAAAFVVAGVTGIAINAERPVVK